MIDVAAFVGPYPYRYVENTSPQFLVGEMDEMGIEIAWTADLPSSLYKDPRGANRDLLKLLEPFRERLHPVLTIHPGMPDWKKDVDQAVKEGAPAIRAYPMQQGLEPAGREMKELVTVCAEERLALVLTVKFEDVRQRHPLDTAPDLPASAVRALARESQESVLVITAPDRSFVEEVHFGLTPEEAARVFYDIGWIWGPPSNDLDRIVRTVGARRFVIGTGMPLRIPDAINAKLDLSSLSKEDRAGIERRNIETCFFRSPKP